MANTLFEQILKPNTEQADTVYYLTNNYNLREVLSSQYIGSLYAYDDKYYDDFLRFGAGYIPLFKAPVSAETTSLVNDHDFETSFAVLLEVKMPDINKKSSNFINQSGETYHGLPSDDMYCVAWETTIPFSAVSKIHFLNEENQAEFESREYEDLPNPRHLYRVSPGLLGVGLDGKRVADWLKTLEPITAPDPDSYKKMEQTAGAIVLCANVVKGDTESIKELLQFLQVEANDVNYSVKRLPYWFKNGLNGTIPDALKGTLDVEQSLFTATIRVLRDIEISNISRREILLNDIESAFHSINDNPDHRETANKSFQAFSKYFTHSAEISPVEPKRNYDVARALLLFLMRPNPDHLLSWSRKETGADDNIMLTAAAFAGIVAGRKGLSLRYRKEINQKISEKVVESLSKLSASAETIAAAPVEAVNNIKTIDSSDKKTSVEKKSSLAAGNLNSTDIKQQLLEANLTLPGTQLDLALALCKHMKWVDCIESLLVCPSDKDIVVTQVKRRKLVNAVRVAGYAEIEYILNEVIFKTHLDKTDPNDKNFKKAVKLIQK